MRSQLSQNVAQAIQVHPAAGYLYTDEDKIDDAGRRYDPQFKGGWSPEMAITHNYTHHFTVIRRAVIERAGSSPCSFTCPAGVKAQDSLGALIFELNLSQGQIDQIRWFFSQYSQKQGDLPTAVDVALQNRASIRQVITGAPFNQYQAQQVAQQITSVSAPPSLSFSCER